VGARKRHTAASSGEAPFRPGGMVGEGRREDAPAVTVKGVGPTVVA